MNIIISPAKKMKEDLDSLAWQDLPRFLPQAQVLCHALQQLSYPVLKKLWRCNDQIAAQNVERLRGMDLTRHLTPALLSYQGIQYQYMAPGVFSNQEWSYVQQHLRILSGFYGLLRPLDGVTPYRLEMQARLHVDGAKDLYAFWGDRLAQALLEEDDCILNLASKEYSISVSRHLPPQAQLVTCVFGELQGNKVVEKGTLCKMARGEMVRFLAEHQAEDLSAVKAFDRLDYQFEPTYSDQTTFVFLRQPTKRRTPGTPLPPEW